MKHPHQQPALERECSEVLQQWEDWSEMPMLVLSFAWLGLFIVELVWGLTPILEAIGTTIWIAFILEISILQRGRYATCSRQRFAIDDCIIFLKFCKVEFAYFTSLNRRRLQL